jgi:predicted PolB exonuclease-like 3'-5' exonuclease
MITVKKIDNTTFEVTVESGTTTTHTVTLEPDYYQKLTGGHVSEEELIKKSFEFLLEREPNTSILRSFDLPVINRYFSEYERTIQKRLT